ncbi:MAG: methyltransferase family protein [Candidatus Thorarchaeota archaeon]
MYKGTKRGLPIIVFAFISFLILFFSISVLVIIVLQLPWIMPLLEPWNLAIGAIFLAVGFPIMLSALRGLGRRAFGSELFSEDPDIKLITDGIYNHTRNPIYFSATLLFLGWFFVLRFTVIAIMTFLFLILFSTVAKWEERELKERFGDEYVEYQNRVPFFIPSLRRRFESIDD